MAEFIGGEKELGVSLIKTHFLPGFVSYWKGRRDVRRIFVDEKQAAKAYHKLIAVIQRVRQGNATDKDIKNIIKDEKIEFKFFFALANALIEMVDYLTPTLVHAIKLTEKTYKMDKMLEEWHFPDKDVVAMETEMRNAHQKLKEALRRVSDELGAAARA